MKRRIFVCILALCMILTAMPVAVYAEEPVGENEWNSDCPVPHQYVICGLCEDAQCEKCNGGHSTFKCVVYQEASCEQPKKYAHICNCCGQMMGSGEDSLLLGISKAEKAFGHTFVDVVVLKEGSCDVAGIKKQECTTCGKIEYVTFYSHDFEVTVIEATCTEPAKVGEKCTVCGLEGETEVVAGSEALGHDLQLDTENEGYVAATCEEGGHDTLKCSRCDYTEEKDTEALGHQYDEGVHTEATCEDASGVLYTCEVCGATYVEPYPDEIGEEALGHDYEAEVTEPTCAAGGYTTYTCTRCGDSYTADETEANPDAHVAVLGTVLKAPTCTTTGIGRYECEVCGANLGYQVITATHKWDAGEVVEEATCGTDGKMVYHCTVEGCDGEKEEVIPATGAHNMEETVIEATCTEPAKVGEKCTVCGQEGETEVVAGSEALGHDLQLDTENEGYVAATCEEGGHDTLKCSRCDYTEEKDTEALGHQYDEGVHTEATCEDASGVLYTCEVCGATKVEEYPPEIGEEALGHDYEAEVTEPTCAAGGYTTYTCTRCGDSYTADETEADPEAHVAVLGTVLKAPTCTTTGIGRYECEVCGANLGYQVITATHKWDAGEVVEEATCGTDGKMVYHCTVEGCDGEKEEVIPATGAHNMEETVIEATCTEPAKVGEKCTVCGLEGETEVVAGSEALGHDLQLDTENEGYVAATCEEGGHDTLKCSRCDYTEEKDTEALGHQYDEGVHTEATCEDASGVLYTCEVCGATKVEEYPPEIGEEALGHDYEAEVTEPTCAAGGYTTYTCTRCGDSYMADETEADPEAHVAVLGTVLKAPTCTTTGIGRYECEVCGANLGYQVITATHKWDAGEVVEEATCGTDGKMVYHCTVEGCDGEKEEVIPATGAHNMEESVIEATCTEPAKVGEKCTVCGQEGETEVVAGSEALGHDLQLDTENEGYVAATCEEGGHDTLKCSRCDYTEEKDTEALGHQYDEGVHTEATCEDASGVLYTCEVCGATKVEEYPPEIGEEALGHDYEAEVTEPTCAAGGYTTYTCTRCGDSYTADETEADPEAHVAVLGTVLKAPTCTTTGIGRYECEVCGANLGYQVITATHKWDAGEVVEEATCGTDGKIVHHCTVEGCDGEKEEIIPATGAHNMEESVIEATCTEPAKVGEKCTVCGLEGETEVVAGSEALGHDLQLDTENEGYVAATCEEGGHDTLKCSRCDYTEEKDTEALGHQYDEGVHTEATCEAASGVLYTCEVCGATYVEEYPEGIGEEALGHDYEAEVTEPTCAAGGYTTYTCTRCGDSYTADETEADPEAHVWNEHVLKEATCTTPGIVRKTCELCGVSTVESILAEHQWSEDMAGNACVYRRCEICGAITIVATFEGYEDCEGQHTPVDVPEIPATNETEGRTAGKVCSVCGVILEGCDTIPVLDHTHEWDEGVVTLEPTCTAAGKKIFTCFCGATREEEIPASGHAEETLPSKAATCTEDGLTEGKKCSVCGAILVAQETIPASGHVEESLPSKAATCTEDGLTEGKQCSVCGEILVAQATIPASGHAEETMPGKAATCTEDGLTEGKQCSVCGEILVAQEIIPASHVEKILPGKAATCTEEGLTEGKQCSVCGAILVAQETIPANGHAEESLPGKAATCTETGLTEGKQCSVCGEILVAQETIPANGHAEESLPGKAATCTEAGLTEGKQCSVCGAILVAQEIIPVAGHSYTVSYSFNADFTKRIATYTCSICQDSYSVEEDY